MGCNVATSKSVEDYLNEVDYNFEGYIPSTASLNFVNFIKLVTGGTGETNKTPVVHYQLLDNIFSKKSRLAILCHRGFAKSTLLTTYLPFYIAVFGKLDNFGVVNYILAVLDSQEGGAKTMRRSMEQLYNNSEFLKKYITYTRFTDDFIELENIEGHRLGIKLTGAQMAIRGTRFSNKNGSHRPELVLMDDILKDSDAKSPTVIEAVEHTIHRAVDKAVHPTRNKIIYIGTVFSAKDPLYKVIESGRWSPSVYPVCEHFPCSREEFKGSWEDRFPYEVVKRMYDDAIAMGRPGDFNVEMMNRVMSEEDRLILDTDITWYKRSTVLTNKQLFNFYITTDFATSERTSSDYSVISVWAYSSNGDWLLVDGICKRQLMDKNVDDLFRLAQKYKPQQVGIEVSGQQGGFIPWLQNEMLTRNIYFTLASEGNNNKPGIRPATQKMQRFNTVVPWFKLGKVWFPEDMKEHPLIVEAIGELSLASPTQFKSKHDDVIDTISQLAFLKPWKPSEESAFKLEDVSKDIWELDIPVEQDSSLHSYIV
jgi:predicted phage terminase large subunit-like protein